MKPYLFFVALFLPGIWLFAQDGDSYFGNEDYYNASRYYEIEVKKSPEKYLKLAKSYFALKQFDKAAKALESYKKEYSSADISTANQLLELLRRDDDEVELRAMSNINTNDGEYSPLISKDGQTLYFVGYDRPGGKGGEDIFYCTKNDDGSWGAPKPFDAFNTDSHETLKAISADNNAVILFGNYPGSFGSGDLFYSINVNGSWTYPCNLGGAINTNDWESQANLSSDGRFMLFASKRSSGQGESDIYVSELTDEGWTTPVNLGNTINTSGDERTPFLAADGKTMYFSSDGHFGFGSYDLFVSKRLDDSWTSWSRPVNMGKYINTLGGDTYFSIPESGSRAYIVGSGGIETNGSDDIFEFILPPSMRPEALFHVKGTVLDESDSAAAVVIRYIDMEDGKEVAKTISSSVDGKYAVSIPSFRKYQVIIDNKGFLYYSTILDLTDPSKYFAKKDFATLLGNDYQLLTESKSRMDSYNNKYDFYLGADQDTEMLGNFENLIKLSSQYDKEAFEMDRILRNARYQYLSELENQREVVQDHDVTRIKVGAKFEVKNIFFDFGKATLRNDSKVELDKLYDIMNRSEIVIEFGGHTDNVGSDEANQALSQERVNSVKTYLVDKGINEARIAAVGYGESQPVADNETDAGRQKNRRVELKITSLRLDREGSDEIKADESYDGLKEESLLVAGKSVQEDLLNKFRKAAEKGGLPSGSDCGIEEEVAPATPKVVKAKKVKNKKAKKVKPAKTKKVKAAKVKTGKVKKSKNTTTTTTTPSTTTTPNYNTTTTTPNYNNSGSTRSGSTRSSSWTAIEDLDDYIYKKFNPNLQSYGNSFGNSTTVGVNFLKERNLRELHFDYGLFNSDDIKSMGSLKWIWTVQAASPLYFHYGVDFTLVNSHFHGNGGYFNVPLGARYIFDMQGIKLGPEFFYNVMVSADDQLGKTSYARLGVNARWKFLQGGLFLNRGDFVKYAGFRVGFAL